jgi:hypothetical protein
MGGQFASLLHEGTHVLAAVLHTGVVPLHCELEVQPLVCPQVCVATLQMGACCGQLALARHCTHCEMDVLQ